MIHRQIPENPSENVVYGDMVLVSGIYIVPASFLIKLEGKELEDTISRVTDPQKKEALKKVAKEEMVDTGVDLDLEENGVEK